MSRAEKQSEIILASGSPRRKMLMEGAGVKIRVEVSEADESHQAGEGAKAYLARTARAKADAVWKLHRGEDVFIIAADTVVVRDDVILGKPADEAQAREMLESLSGRAHEVMTGVCVVDVANDRCEVFISETAVHFTKLEAREIERYIQTGEPLDKAGAYGIQAGAARFVERIEGSYTNVVGLPLCETISVLKQLGAVLDG